MNKHDLTLEAYGRRVQRVFGLDGDPLALMKSLCRLERRAHKLAEDYVCGYIDTDGCDEAKDELLRKLDDLIDFTRKDVPVFINTDPRGYALKIRSDYTQQHNLDLITDLGGYGLLAPNFQEK